MAAAQVNSARPRRIRSFASTGLGAFQKLIHSPPTAQSAMMTVATVLIVLPAGVVIGLKARDSRCYIVRAIL
jgi:ABC-type sulfate transport system permease subunit